ncbi:variable large family protein (plasmid) [Borrelia coriaceae]|uniref:Variable large protein n=1 Tax=Borrelia coriaceae ATCC 43381 TaxID=1408429 RepID=W5T300_9SPIR|nr:variable large family protein [Borrelia coriaceae]AHH11696.1 Variable outer membrane protein [Borrelia coriaceae ATCC 43381]UPA17185.1 variable large family protein [Borrelia coriaceae]
MKINIKNINIKSICATLFISLFLSCNNSGEELEKLQKDKQFYSSIAKLGNDFLDIFTSFGEMSNSVLGFNTETKKSDVKDYFKNIEKSLTITRTTLDEIVANMEKENNRNASGTKAAVITLNDKLDNIIKGAKAVSDAIADASDPIGNVADASSPAGVEGKIESLIKGIKDIVDVVLKNEGNAEAGDDKKAENLTKRTGGTTAGEAGKLFDNSTHAGDAANSKKAAADAVKAVGAVTGADILKAMIKSSGDNKKDGIIAGTITLRAMAKDGKFAGPNSKTDEAADAIKGAAISAVTKALSTLTIAIRKTIDEGLKEVKKAMKINPDDTPVISDNNISETKK